MWGAIDGTQIPSLAPDPFATEYISRKDNWACSSCNFSLERSSLLKRKDVLCRLQVPDI